MEVVALNKKRLLNEKEPVLKGARTISLCESIFKLTGRSVSETLSQCGGNSRFDVYIFHFRVDPRLFYVLCVLVL
jgi:hypothetical protein